MTATPDDELIPELVAPGAPGLQFVQQQIEQLLSRRSMIALQLHQAAQQSVGPVAQQMELMSRWFDQPVTADDVLHHPEALAICQPLLVASKEHASAEVANEKTRLEDAVRHWESTLSSRPTRNRLWIILVYPLVLAFASIAILMVICVLLVPSFEEMMDEFGLSLPYSTQTVFAISHFARDYGLWLLAALVAIVLVSQLVRYRAHRVGQDPPWVRLGRRLFMPARLVWASWAEHVAMMLDTGLTRREAYQIAGESSPSRWMSNLNARCVQSINEGRNPLAGPTHIHGKPCHLMIHAVQTETIPQQADCMRDVAAIYRDRERHQRRDILTWVSPLIVCMLGMTIGWVMVALFMPLVQLISGLT
ncbi:type II secretion system F family protein [Rhodopirellula sp. P2]|uniref:type II secretion system F family protein n=1 Tax=Rhodopirellula sp. P2 TaxID=2127060 RepID=UPI002368662F|nr:type II secretion system F family protein [Rhodopirellula sp. P2]WDQ18167.1 type II secretion system F family protein [Rhodopirellula sp. P2]